MSGFSHTIQPYGEFGLLATLNGGDMIARALGANTIADRLRKDKGVIDSVAGVESLVVRFNPAELSVEDASRKLEAALGEVSLEIPEPVSKIEIPVCYGGVHGPDFDMLCDRLSLGAERMIELHSSTVYRVLTIGFAPGFAYLGPLPEALRTTRLSQPRARVPEGSIGVAGAMTGVYPLASPGGWPLIGRTPKTLFNARSPAPFLFAPGAEVRFMPISETAFPNFKAGET